MKTHLKKKKQNYHLYSSTFLYFYFLFLFVVVVKSLFHNATPNLPTYLTYRDKNPQLINHWLVYKNKQKNSHAQKHFKISVKQDQYIKLKLMTTKCSEGRAFFLSKIK